MITFLALLWGKIPSSVKAALFGIALAIAAYFGFRVWLVRHDASILKGYVTQAKLDAVNATVSELQRQKQASEYVVASYSKQLAKAQAADAAQDAQEAKDRQSYEAQLSDLQKKCRALGEPDLRYILR